MALGMGVVAVGRGGETDSGKKLYGAVGVRGLSSSLGLQSYALPTPKRTKAKQIHFMVTNPLNVALLW